MKKVSAVAFVALAFLIFIIWKDPVGAANIVRTFVDAVGSFFSALWDKLGEFLGNLTK
jgi:hypothetical protein